MTQPNVSYDQRLWNVSEPWIEFMIEAARHYSHRDAATPFLDGIYLRPGYQSYRVRGSILPHTDRASPEWSYILVFRADDSVLHCHGQPAVRLKPGMLLEFNEHQRHRLEQDPESLFIWNSFDGDHRLSFEEVVEGHRRKFNEGASVLIKGTLEQHVVTNRHRIVYDGRIMRAYDAQNFCVCFLDRAGFSVAYQEADARGATHVRDPLLTMRRPRLSDWNRMQVLLAEHHGLVLPDVVMPKFMTGEAEAHY